MNETTHPFGSNKGLGALDARIEALVAMSLAGGCNDATFRAAAELRARAVGLSGAEIDAAAAGSSFDVRAAFAVRYACALRSGNQDLCADRHDAALGAGFETGELQRIRELVSEFESRQR